MSTIKDLEIYLDKIIQFKNITKEQGSNATKINIKHLSSF